MRSTPSSARGDTLSLLVARSDPQWRQTTTWRILVISRSASAAYSITAAQGHPPIYVADGRPTDIGEAVAVAEYRYFRMLVLSAAYPVTVTVTLQSGAASLFVSTTEPLPSADTAYSFNASGMGIGASISVTVPGTSLPSYVYAGVRVDGSAATRYTVLFSTGLVLVQAGALQAASCSAANAFVIYPPFNRSGH